MNHKNSHIVLVHDERVPEDLLDDFCLNVKARSLKFDRVKNPAIGPYATLEYFVFPAVALLILKPYFDGFMAEAGREHYVLLRNGLKNLWKRLFGRERKFRFAMMTASREKKLRHSASFSIYTISDAGYKVKFLIKDGCSEDEFSSSIDAFLDFIEAYHHHSPLKGCTISLDIERPMGGHILVEYDKISKSLKIVDPIPTKNELERSRT